MIDLTEMQRLINHPDANALGLSIQVRPYDSAHPFVAMICPDGGAHYFGHGATAKEAVDAAVADRSEEHTSELQSLMRISYAVFCSKKKTKQIQTTHHTRTTQ